MKSLDILSIVLSRRNSRLPEQLRPYSMLLTACLLLAGLPCRQAHALELETTNSGCQLSMPRADDFQPPPGGTVASSITWTGRCVNGKIEGYGEIRRHREVVVGNIRFSTTQITRSHAMGGRLLGFGFETFETQVGSAPAKRTRPRWIFNDYSDEQVSFQGLGLDGNFQLLRNTRDHLPRRVVSIPKIEPGGGATSIRISDGKRSANLDGADCMLNVSDFPECDGPSATTGGRFTIYYFYRSAGRDLELPTSGNKNIKYCPEPRNIDTCAPFIEPLTADIIASINARIQAFLSQLESGDANLRSVLREVGVSK